MNRYGVKEVSKLAGISVRTLHYYDQIGLLKPAKRTEAGYRHYGESELLRLQQILFFKELDFPLKKIIEFLDAPGFDLVPTLETHKQALKARQQRISNLLNTIDKTIDKLKNGDIMSKPEELYEGLPKEMGTTLRQEAINEYGKEAIERSERELMKLGKEGFKQLQTEFKQVTKDLFGLMNHTPESAQVQQLIARHYVLIRKFWGTSTKADKQAEAYAGLGKLYVSDPRYTSIDGVPKPAFAQFLEKAMGHFANTQLK